MIGSLGYTDFSPHEGQVAMLSLVAAHRVYCGGRDSGYLVAVRPPETTPGAV
jgi:hypothetical protein